jgi:hypothetical protein
VKTRLKISRNDDDGDDNDYYGKDDKYYYGKDGRTTNIITGKTVTVIVTMKSQNNPNVVVPPRHEYREHVRFGDSDNRYGVCYQDNTYGSF